MSVKPTVPAEKWKSVKAWRRSRHYKNFRREWDAITAARLADEAYSNYAEKRAAKIVERKAAEPSNVVHLTPRGPLVIEAPALSEDDRQIAALRVKKLQLRLRLQNTEAELEAMTGTPPEAA